MKILVTGVGGTAGQNLVRALRREPEAEWIVGTDTNRYFLHAADADEKHLVPPATDRDAWLLAMERLADEVDLILPQPDPEVRLFSQERDRFPGRLHLPSMEAIALCQHKLRTAQALAAARVPVPESVPYEQLPSLLSGGRAAWLRPVTGAGSAHALKVWTMYQADAWVGRDRSIGHWMASVYLPGRDVGHQSVWWHGQCLAILVRQRLAYAFGHVSPNGTSSTPSIALTINEPETDLIAAQAVFTVDPQPHGVYGVDLKADEAGRLCVTEINAGRYFSTAAALGAAIDCPLVASLLRMHAGEPLPRAITRAEPGWLWIRVMDRPPMLCRQEELDHVEFSRELAESRY